MEKGIGIYIGRKEVIAASVSISKGVPELHQFAVEPIGANEGALPSAIEKKKSARKPSAPEAEAIERALEKLGARGSHVVASFNPFHLATRYFEMPAIPKREWPEAVRYEAGRYIPFKLSESIVDHHVVERKTESGAGLLAVTVSGVRRDTLRSYVQHLRQGSAKVDMIEPVFAALSRVISSVEKAPLEKTQGFIFMDADGGVNITLARAGITYLCRDFLLSEDRRANETRFYEELKASFDFILEKTGDDLIEKVYFAGSGELAYWAEFLSSVFGKQASFETASFPTQKEIPKNVISALLVPIGLALRKLKRPSPLGDLSLLPTEERETAPERVRRIIGIEFLVIALSFILLRLAILEPYAAYVKKISARGLSAEAASDLDLAGRPLSDLESVRSGLQSRISQLKRSSEENISTAAALTTLAKLLPKSMWLDQISYRSASAMDRSEEFSIVGSGKGGKILTLEGLCYLGNADQEVQEINKWLKALTQDKVFMSQFKTVTIEEVRREGYQSREVTRFRMLCR